MRNKELFELYKEYFLKDIPNTLEWTQMKVIAIKKLKANRFRLTEIKEAVGIHYKNCLKLNARETNKNLELLFETYVINKIYPIKTKNKLTWKQQA